MTTSKVLGRLGGLAAAFFLGTSVLTAPVLAQSRAPQAVAASSRDWASNVWTAAAGGDRGAVLDLLARAPEDDAADLRDGFDRLEQNLAKREELRREAIDEINTRLDEHLAADETDLTLSKALEDAVELEMHMADKEAFRSDPRIVGLVKHAEKAARAAEDRGDWLMASELFYRMNLIDESAASYKEDIERVTRRLSMIAMYAPRQLWDLRSARRVLEGEEPLPAYNPIGDDYRVKLADISEHMVVRAIDQAAKENNDDVSAADMLRGGFAALRTFATTQDLAAEFEGLGDPEKVAKFVAAVDGVEQDLRNFRGFQTQIRSLVSDAGALGKVVGVPPEVIVYELGNGSMATLDDYSVIIWPDDIRRFQRSTQGKFIGIGVQIRLNELSNIEVVTPLEGTPAQRSGIRSGDVISAIDDDSALGMSLDQAVDVITGPEGTKVKITVEREENEGEKEVLDFLIPRAEIKLRSVKGWQRVDQNEDHWNWFIDEDNGIGYVRLTQFHEATSRELDDAVREMKAAGLEAMILDLRFNPGGLLDQAVEVTSRFVDGRRAREVIPGGIVVSTRGAHSQPRNERVLNNRASLADIPVIILVNEGSASASEIVCGTLQDYSRAGLVKGLVLGSRTYGKGSVQNVSMLGHDVPAALKLTTAQYFLAGGRQIHRHPGRRDFGVEPDLEVDLLPDQITESIRIRQDADVIPLDQHGMPMPDAEPADPSVLLTDGIDLQLETALVLLQSQTALRPAKPIQHAER